jgi:hypothetical protein
MTGMERQECHSKFIEPYMTEKLLTNNRLQAIKFHEMVNLIKLFNVFHWFSLLYSLYSIISQIEAGTKN